MARPREFDEDQAIARAMELFWSNGFEGTSLDALEESTGMNRSSLYNTFGGKLDLFRRSLQAYSAGPCQDLFRPLRDQRGADALHGYLEVLRQFIRSSQASRGCMMVNTSLELDALDDGVHDQVDIHFRTLRSGFRAAYGAGIEDGTVNQDFDRDEAADWLLVFVRGVLAGAASGEAPALLVGAIQAAAKQMGLARG